MFEFIEQTDRQLFLRLNGMHSGFLDALMPYLTEFWVWIPLFAWWLFELYRKYHKKVITVALLVIPLVVFTDQGANAIKKTVQRYRPSHNLEIKEQVHVVNDYRGGEFGFVSNHASNVFGIAFYVFFMLRPAKRVITMILFAWAILVAYSRIYLGVHYPLDILGGALLGFTIALLMSKLARKAVA